MRQLHSLMLEVLNAPSFSITPAVEKIQKVDCNELITTINECEDVTDLPRRHLYLYQVMEALQAGSMTLHEAKKVIYNVFSF